MRRYGKILQTVEKIRRTDFVHLADEWMIERGSGQRLTPETFARNRIVLCRRRKKFDRNAPLQPRVVCEKDFTHAPEPRWPVIS